MHIALLPQRLFHGELVTFSALSSAEFSPGARAGLGALPMFLDEDLFYSAA
jgi:hypothetical protein